MRRYLLLLLLPALLIGCAAAEELTLKTKGQYFSFADNQFVISSPIETDAQITIESLGSTYLRVSGVQLTQGENLWTWNGLGFHGEPMPRGDYDLCVQLDDGARTVLPFSMGKPKQALHYALPQSDTLYLDDRSSWGMQL